MRTLLPTRPKLIGFNKFGLHLEHILECERVLELQHFVSSLGQVEPFFFVFFFLGCLCTALEIRNSSLAKEMVVSPSPLICVLPKAAPNEFGSPHIAVDFRLPLNDSMIGNIGLLPQIAIVRKRKNSAPVFLNHRHPCQRCARIWTAQRR